MKKISYKSDAKNADSEKGRKYSKRTLLWMGVLFSVLPIAGFYLMEFYDRNPFEQIRPDAHRMNIILFELMAWGLFFLLGRARAAARILLLGQMIYGLANHYVVLFRSRPIVPWDIYSLKTAFSVAGGYDFTLTKSVVLISLLFLLLMAVAHFAGLRWTRREKRNAYIRILPALICMFGLILFAGKIQDADFQNEHRLYPYLYTPGVMVKYNGLAVTFTMDLAYIHVDKPEGYDRQECLDILSEYESKASGNTSSENTLPNIIVIMDEAFSDPAVLGDLNTNEDYMPFTHSMLEGAEDTVSGRLHVSVCGGNTANTEFEFLTGNTCAFLPEGSVAYQQYLKNETDSLPLWLKSLGYETCGMHPYYGSGWERDRVYPLLGFDHCLFIDDFVSKSYVRNYVSDSSCVDQIEQLLEENGGENPLFLFAVTMQNHGGYTDDSNFTGNIQSDIDNQALDTYLSLISLTDAELRRLSEYVDGCDEKTILVYFGDHQPADSVVAGIPEKDGLDEDVRYQVPFVIHANFDLEEESGLDLSADYLSGLLLEKAGLPQSGYTAFLRELGESIPVISAPTVESLEEGKKDPEGLETYRKLQYYEIFDHE